MKMRTNSRPRRIVERGVVLNAAPLQGIYPKTQIGSGAHIRSHAVLYRGSLLGRDVFCGHSTVIREGCRIGDGVKLGSHSTLDPHCIVDDHATVHSHCYLGEYTHVKTRAWIGPGVVTLNTTYPKCGHPNRRQEGAMIGEHAVVGAAAVLLPGVIIGAHAMVAAGAVVTRNVPRETLVVGTPARVVKRVSSIRCCPSKRYRR